MVKWIGFFNHYFDKKIIFAPRKGFLKSDWKLTDPLVRTRSGCDFRSTARVIWVLVFPGSCWKSEPRTGSSEAGQRGSRAVCPCRGGSSHKSVQWCRQLDLQQRAHWQLQVKSAPPPPPPRTPPPPTTGASPSTSLSSAWNTPTNRRCFQVRSEMWQLRGREWLTNKTWISLTGVLHGNCRLV